MRAFLLIALCTMTATVCCQVVPSSPPSTICNSTSSFITNNTNVITTKQSITKNGCNELISLENCRYEDPCLHYTCRCSPSYNASAWELSVRELSGRVCYVDIFIRLFGNITINNKTRTVTLYGQQSNVDQLAFGNGCNTTEMANMLYQTYADTALNILHTSMNFQKGNVTWYYARAGITAQSCDVFDVPPIFATIPTPTSTSAPTTTSPPITTSAPDTTFPPISTSAPNTTSPPTTSAPTSIINSNDASIITSSITLITSFIATIIIVA